MYNQSVNRLQAPDIEGMAKGMPAYRNLAEDPEFKKAMNPGKMESILGYSGALSPILNGIFSKFGGNNSTNQKLPNSFWEDNG